MTKSRIAIGGAVLAIILIGAILIFRPKAPAEGDAAGAPGQPVAALTVTTAPPLVEEWADEVLVSGVVAPWQEVIVSAQVGGQVVDNLFADVGDTMKAGDLLVVFSNETINNQILQLEASLASNAVALQQAEADLARGERLRNGGSISDQQLNQFRAAEQQAQSAVDGINAQLASAKLDLTNAQVEAPVGGVISSRSVSKGEVVAMGTELYRIIRDNRMEWQAQVPLLQIFNIDVGMKVRIPTPYGDLPGVVSRIAPEASATNGRVLVYVDVNIEGRSDLPDPKAGIAVNGAFEVGQSEAMSVPSSAIVMQDGFSYVFILQADDPTRVARVRIETGRRQGDRVEIIGEVPADAEVVQAGGAFLSDGVVVHVVKPTDTPNEGTKS